MGLALKFFGSSKYLFTKLKTICSYYFYSSFTGIEMYNFTVLVSTWSTMYLCKTRWVRLVLTCYISISTRSATVSHFYSFVLVHVSYTCQSYYIRKAFFCQWFFSLSYVCLWLYAMFTYLPVYGLLVNLVESVELSSTLCFLGFSQSDNCSFFICCHFPLLIFVITKSLIPNHFDSSNGSPFLKI
jgi:hypothetical protein